MIDQKINWRNKLILNDSIDEDEQKCPFVGSSKEMISSRVENEFGVGLRIAEKGVRNYADQDH